MQHCHKRHNAGSAGKCSNGNNKSQRGRVLWNSQNVGDRIRSEEFEASLFTSDLVDGTRILYFGFQTTGGNLNPKT